MGYVEGLRDASNDAGEVFQQPLIRFRFCAAVLVAHPVFVEHLRHFFSDHVAVVLNGNKRDFFSHLGHWLWSGSFWGRGWSFWCLTHEESIHHAGGEKASYSNASREDCSGYVFWHEVQVRK